MLTQHIFRLDADTDRELADLAAALRTTEAGVVRRAIRELARRELAGAGAGAGARTGIADIGDPQKNIPPKTRKGH